MNMGVPEEEQVEECKARDKRHNKKMYPQKEYMEEYLKFKDVIGNMKKWVAVSWGKYDFYDLKYEM